MNDINETYSNKCEEIHENIDRSSCGSTHELVNCDNVESDSDDDEFAESFYESINRIQHQGSFRNSWNKAGQPTNRKIMIRGYQNRFNSQEEIVVRPMAAYSRHLVKDVKDREREAGNNDNNIRQSSHGDPLGLLNSTNAGLGVNKSLLLAKGTEDVWRCMRQLTSPTDDDDDDEFVYTTSVEIPEQSSPSNVGTPRNR